MAEASIDSTTDVCSVVSTPRSRRGSLRVGTLNVHWFGRPKRMDALIEMLREHKLDVICLQEANYSGLKLIADRLENARGCKDTWSYVCADAGGTLANGILIRHSSIGSDSTVSLLADGSANFISEFRFREFMRPLSALEPAFYHENRAMAATSCPLLHIPATESCEESVKKAVSRISVGCTHLCHVHESVRKLQLRYFMERFAEWSGRHAATDRHSKGPLLLCGDFNALNRRDYSAAEWRHIYEVREANEWELPEFELTEWIQRRKAKKPLGVESKSKSKKGQSDGGLEYVDVFELFCKERFWAQLSSTQRSDLFADDFQLFGARMDRMAVAKLQMAALSADADDSHTTGSGLLSRLKKATSSKRAVESKEESTADSRIQALNAQFFDFCRLKWKATCRFDTRIDYVFVAQRFVRECNVSVADCYTADTIATAITDHNLFVAELTFDI